MSNRSSDARGITERRKEQIKKACAIVRQKGKPQEDPPLKRPIVCFGGNPDLPPPPEPIKVDDFEGLEIGIRCVVERHRHPTRDQCWVESFRGTIERSHYNTKRQIGTCDITLDSGIIVFDIPQCYIGEKSRKSVKWQKRQPKPDADPETPETLNVKCEDCGADREVKRCDAHHVKRCKDCQAKYAKQRARERRKKSYERQKAQKAKGKHSRKPKR